MRSRRSLCLPLALLCVTAACGGEPAPMDAEVDLDAEVLVDAGAEDAGRDASVRRDAGVDAGSMELDAGPLEMDAGADGGPTEVDAGVDGGPMEIDAGVDAGPVEVDAGMDGGPMEVDAGVDAGPMEMDAGVDAGPPAMDAGPMEVDAGTDAGPVGCASDAACSNGNACDGAERCVSGTCLPALAPLVCNDGRACTTDTCVAPAGCVFTPLDADGDGDGACTDCNDADPAFRHGATELCNALDDDCDLSTDEGVVAALYSDCDGDGWASLAAVSVSTCTAPPATDTGCVTDTGDPDPRAAWTPRAPTDTDFDCADNEPTVHTSVVSFFTGSIASSFDPATDYDYDCDLVEQPQFPDLGACERIGASCVRTPGWLDVAVPECGVEGMFITGCNASCTPITVLRQQACR